MNILERLEEDHQSFRALAGRLDRSAGRLMDPSCPAERERRLARGLARTLRSALERFERHDHAERRFLFPEIRRREETAAAALDRTEKKNFQLEERIAKVISELPRLSAGPPRVLGSRLKSLVSPLMDHVRWEESSVYPLAKGCVPKPRLENLQEQEDLEEFPELVDDGAVD